MLHGQVALPVISQAHIQFPVFFISDVVRVSGPNWLCFVQFFLIDVILLDHHLLLLVAILLLLLLVRANVFDFGLVVRLLLFFFFLLLLFLFLCFIITDLSHSFSTKRVTG